MKFLIMLACVAVAASAEGSEVLKEFAAENLQYIGELYTELTKEHVGNFIACPLSIQAVFALVNSGARGNTSAQITKALHLPEGEEKIRETFIQLTENIQRNSNYTLSSANKIYLAEYFNISSKYRSTAVDVFNAEVQNIDFMDVPQAVLEINGWVENKTHNKIKDLVTENTISADTVAVLINALYFQGTWLKRFGDTLRPMQFLLNKKDSVTVDMMTVGDNFNYYESPELGAKFVELPYEGEDVSMTFVLPDSIEGLPALEARIGDVLVAPKYQSSFIYVQIPKFKIETTTHLIPALVALGIEDAFSGQADLTGIGENAEHLSITEVVQKAFIEVDEKGTTAAAATVVVINRSGMGDRMVFTADHPFLFYLKHKVNGVLFVGRYSAPAPKST